MASQSKGFSHISVSEEDDDLVIQAGAYDRDASEGSACEPETDAGAEGEVADDRPPIVESEEVSQARVEDAVREAAPQAAKQQKPDEAPMRTSLEDLESAKMGTLQKVIVAVAAVAIVAFAVYYICFM